jgi:hypothetical protein
MLQGSASNAEAGPIDFPLNEEHLVLGEDVRQGKRAKGLGLAEGLGELFVEHCMVKLDDGICRRGVSSNIYVIWNDCLHLASNNISC